ncbi:MAG: diguanylate cyclase, partial [Granulosicoccus sp.]|nr:diguanylate cyclase [Granulosicoccus sp.]
MGNKSVSRRETIRLNQNDLLYSGIKFTAIGSIAAGFVVVWTFADRTNPTSAIIWLTLLLSAYLFRLYDSRQYRLAPTRVTRVSYWQWRFNAGTFCAAAAWASSIWLIYPVGDSAHQVLLVLALGGVAAGALASLPYDRFASNCFQIIIALSVETRLLLQPDAFSTEIAIFGLFVFGFLLSCGKEVSRNYFDLLCLRQDIQENNLMLIDTTERMAQMGYWQWDMVSPNISVSENLGKMLGTSSSSLALKTCVKYIHREDRQRFDQAIERASESDDEVAIEFQIQDPLTKKFRIMSQVTRRITDSHGKVKLLGTMQDISNIRSAERKIYDMAYYDELTGLVNRAHFHERLPELLSDANRRGNRLALVYLDLDDFKGINDSYGHEVGDKYLVKFGEYLRSVLRRNDLVARLGGDEFCFVIRDVQDQQEVIDSTQRCLQFAHQVVTIDNHRVHPKLSAGIAMYPDDGDDVDQLLRHADMAMYDVKHNGKYGFAFFNPRMAAETADRVRLEADLRQAIGEGEFDLWYQPKIDISTGELSGVEALIRWQHPTRGMIPPDLFIATAERVGMIKEIGEWVIATACAQLQQWRQSGLRLQMAVNVSSSHFASRDFVDFVKTNLERFELQHGELEIEITESTSRDPEEHCRVCHQLRELGVRIAIDDFGTGYSSLSVLGKLEV